MLKNVLEANGYNIIVNFINTNNIGSHYFYEIRKGFNLDTTRHIKYISKEENIEEACKQYVRENGFQKKWLRLVTNDYIKEKKLIAWLYSEDIKIVEE